MYLNQIHTIFSPSEVQRIQTNLESQKHTAFMMKFEIVETQE